jgi:hypothetical protein
MKFELLVLGIAGCCMLLIIGMAEACQSGIHRGRCLEICAPEPLETTTTSGCVCRNAVRPLKGVP